MSGGSHVKLYNAEKNLTYYTSASPSDNRYERNALNDMERMSGRRLPRPNAAKYKTVKVTTTTMRMSDTETAAVAHTDELLAQADKLRGIWNNIIATSNRTHANVARLVLSEYEEIRSALSDKHRIIPPLGV